MRNEVVENAIGNFGQSGWYLVAKIWSTETVIVYPEITLFFTEEVLFFQFFEKMKPFREKFVMAKFEKYKISFLLM